MRSKRRSYNRNGSRNGNSVAKNIAARLAAKLIFDRMLRRRSRRSRRSSNSRSLVQRYKTDNTIPLIVGAIVASYGGYKIYNYYYGEHSISFGNTDGILNIAGNIMKSYGNVEESRGYDITNITLTKKGNTLKVTDEYGVKDYTKVFKNSIDYQLSSDGKYYKFGEFDKPYFYIRKKDLYEVINFLQK